MDEVRYTSKTNFVLIEHPDGTLAQHGLLQKGFSSLKVGNTVYPGDVLGKNQKLANRHGCALVYYYLKTDDIDTNRNKSIQDGKSVYAFLAPLFLTTDGTTSLEMGTEYEAVLTEEIIQREMSKKELKNQQKKR